MGDDGRWRSAGLFPLPALSQYEKEKSDRVFHMESSWLEWDETEIILKQER